jgi:DNA (cytosine-5)-methyltransferase 1
MFGLDVIRHRYFEINPPIYFAPKTCNHYKPAIKTGYRPNLQTHFHSCYGHFTGADEARQAMQIQWMTRDELAQAIPPAYTQWIGQHIIPAIEKEAGQ